MDIGKSLKVELPRFANGSDLGCERMRGIKHDEMVGRDRVRKEGRSPAWKDCGRSRFGGKRNSALVLLKVSGDFKYVFGHLSLQFRGHYGLFPDVFNPPVFWAIDCCKLGVGSCVLKVKGLTSG